MNTHLRYNVKITDWNNREEVWKEFERQLSRPSLMLHRDQREKMLYQVKLLLGMT